MKTIRIMLDYLQGPIWTSDPETGKPETGIDVIDSDQELQRLNHEIQDLYGSYYEFDSHGQACWFDEERRNPTRTRCWSFSPDCSRGSMRSMTGRSRSTTAKSRG